MEEKPMVFDAGRSRESEASSIAAADQKLRIESSHLFQGEREIVIVHRTKEYSLRITRNGKLILTK